MSHIKPFSELQVLDFSRYLPGGYCTQVLADMGARVVKVEDTNQGDFCRHDFPSRKGVSYYITALGRNKESVSFNLKDEEVRDYLLKMAKTADVIVESFRPGVTKKLGVDYDTIRAINPTVIYCSISGYGQNDPRSLKAQHDLNMQAATGYLGINGCQLTPLPLVDYATHSVAAQSILAALHQRDATGEGAFIDISMFDCFVWWNSLIDSRWCFNGGQCYREDLDFPAAAYNIYETKDGGHLAFGMIEKKFWDGFCAAVNRPDLSEAHLHRRWERPEAFEAVESIVRSKTLEEWRKWLTDKDFCIEPVVGKDEGIASILENEPDMLAYKDFPQTGRVLQTGIPHHVSSIPFDLDEVRECSELGADSAAYLRSVGASDDDVNRLAEKGSIRLRGDGVEEPDDIPVFPGNRATTPKAYVEENIPLKEIFVTETEIAQ